ncbi:MAG: SDR family oxidoreductase [Leptospirillum sp.]
MRRILIVGATSAIAQATARLFAKNGDRLFLTGRDPEKLEVLSADLAIRGAAQVDAVAHDVNDFDAHQAIIFEATSKLGGLDTVLIAHGTLPDQKLCQESADLTLREISTNALSVISFLTILANQFEKQGYGSIAVLSSVAGDRGRQSNYVYGTAKAAVSTFLQGLRNRLFRSGVHVMTIKPGFVDTPMTAAFKKGTLWSTPDSVARSIVRGLEQKRDVQYTPFFWRGIMFIIRSIPERIFKKMTL